MPVYVGDSIATAIEVRIAHDEHVQWQEKRCQRKLGRHALAKDLQPEACEQSDDDERRNIVPIPEEEISA